MLTTFLRDAEFPARAREGALKTLDGRLGFSRKCLGPAKLGAEAPPRTDAAGRYLSNVAALGAGFALLPNMPMLYTAARVSFGDADSVRRRPTYPGIRFANSPDKQ